MQQKHRVIILISLVIVLAVVVMSLFIRSESSTDSSFFPIWISLIPIWISVGVAKREERKKKEKEKSKATYYDYDEDKDYQAKRLSAYDGELVSYEEYEDEKKWRQR